VIRNIIAISLAAQTNVYEHVRTAAYKLANSIIFKHLGLIFPDPFTTYRTCRSEEVRVLQTSSIFLRGMPPHPICGAHEGHRHMRAGNVIITFPRCWRSARPFK
jgi:hypothetical protein